MAECIKCGKYAKHESWLCSKCYKEEKSSDNENKKITEDNAKGLSANSG